MYTVPDNEDVIVPKSAIASVPGWVTVKTPWNHMKCVYTFTSFNRRNIFISEIMQYESDTGHIARTLVDGMKVVVAVWTRNGNFVSDLDKEFADFLDAVYLDVTEPV